MADTDTARAIELLRHGTPGPWKAANMIHAERGDRMTPEEIGAYVTANIKRSMAEGGSTDFLFVTTDGDDVPDICHVGNGPMGPLNARRIAANPLLVEVAAAAVELRRIQETTPERDIHDTETGEPDHPGDKPTHSSDWAWNDWHNAINAARNALDAAIANLTRGVLTNG